MPLSLLIVIQLLAFPQQAPDTIDAAAEAPRSTKELVEFHQRLRPEMGVQDVLKLLYQGVFGVEHLLTDTAGVHAYLEKELSGLEAVGMGELLTEPVSAHTGLVRVNLRPFKHLNLDPELLVQVMFRSAAETKPDTLMFYRQWNAFFDLVRYGFLKFPMEEAKRWHEIVTGGPPKPVHHTERYRELYHPAYRVVRKAEFDRMMTKGNE